MNLRQLACRVVGHQPSWWYAVSVGVTNGPVCKRCGAVLGKGREANTVRGSGHASTKRT